MKQTDDYVKLFYTQACLPVYGHLMHYFALGSGLISLMMIHLLVHLSNKLRGAPIQQNERGNERVMIIMKMRCLFHILSYA